MAAYTGTQLARTALKEIGVLDPNEAGHAETLADAIQVGTDMIDSWRNEGLTIEGVTRSVYSLSANTQTYTIGDGGTFNQDYPNAIHLWSVIPDDDAADPVEEPKWRPLTYDQWQAIRVKSTTGSYPTKMYFDRSWAAGLGNCSFYPIPDNADVDVVLYSAIPAITSLVAGTSYNLRPGFPLAIWTNLAYILVNGRFKRQGDWSDLKRRADAALASIKRKAVIPKESPRRSEFAIGARGRRNFSVYNGSFG